MAITGFIYESFIIKLSKRNLRNRPLPNDVRSHESKQAFDYTFFLFSVITPDMKRQDEFAPRQKSDVSIQEGAAGGPQAAVQCRRSCSLNCFVKTSCFVCARVIKQLEFYITLVKINKEHI